MKYSRGFNYLSSLLLFIGGGFAASFSQAEEGGAGHYIPGGVASLIDLPPTQGGWVVETMYLHYEGDASTSRTIPVARVLTGGLEATSDAFTMGILHTFEPKFLGAHYSLGAFLPYVWMDVSANVTLAGRSRTRRDKADGIGDLLLIPAMMAWQINEWQINAFLPIYAPTGDYEVGRLANPGLNHWTFDPTFGGSYNNAKTGFNAAVHTGFAFSTKNEDTDYRNGTIFHADTTVQQLLPLGKGFLGIGAEAFYYQQITGDSGSGAILGDFEGHTFGLGPILSYMLPVGDNTLLAEVRWLAELDTERRLQGDYFWFKIVYQF